MHCVKEVGLNGMDPCTHTLVTHSYFEVDALCQWSRVSGEAIMLEDFMLLQCGEGGKFEKVLVYHLVVENRLQY